MSPGQIAEQITASADQLMKTATSLRALHDTAGNLAETESALVRARSDLSSVAADLGNAQTRYTQIIAGANSAAASIKAEAVTFATRTMTISEAAAAQVTKTAVDEADAISQESQEKVRLSEAKLNTAASALAVVRAEKATLESIVASMKADVRQRASTL